VANFLFILVVASLFVVAARYPGAACGYVLAGMALEQCAQAFVPLANRQDTLCNYLTAGTVLVGLGARILQDRAALPRLRTTSLWVLGLLGYCYLTAAWSIFPATTIAALNRAVPYLVTFVGAAPLLIRSEKDLQACLVTLLFSTLGALALLLLFAEWGGRGVMLPGRQFESNPLALAESAGCLLIVTAFSPLRTDKSRLLGIALLGTALIVTTLVFLRTAARGQVLAALGATVAFSVRQRGGGWLVLALGLGGLLAYGFMPEEVAKNAERWDPEQMRSAVDAGRVHEAERLLTFWSHSSLTHQVLGLGHASAQDPRLLGNYPHVVPVEVLAEEGFVGAFLFALAVGVGATTCFRALRNASTATRRILAATTALLAFEFVLIWKQGSLLGASPLLLLLTIVPEAAGARARSQSERSALRGGSRLAAPPRFAAQRLRSRVR